MIILFSFHLQFPPSKKGLPVVVYSSEMVAKRFIERRGRVQRVCKNKAFRTSGLTTFKKLESFYTFAGGKLLWCRILKSASSYIRQIDGNNSKIVSRLSLPPAYRIHTAVIKTTVQKGNGNGKVVANRPKTTGVITIKNNVKVKNKENRTSVQKAPTANDRIKNTRNVKVNVGKRKGIVVKRPKS